MKGKSRALSRLLHLSVKLEHQVRRGNRLSLRAETKRIADLELLGWLDKGAPVRPIQPLVQGRLDCRLGAPRPIRRPARRAAMTLLSLTTRQSPGRSKSGDRECRDPPIPAARQVSPPGAAPRRGGPPAVARCGPPEVEIERSVFMIRVISPSWREADVAATSVSPGRTGERLTPPSSP